MSRPPVLIFDLDGTLVDSAPGICASARDACETLGVAAPDDAVIRQMIGLPLLEIARLLIGPNADLAVLENWAVEYRAAFDRIALPATRAFPGVPETLTRWRDAGRTLIIATSKRTDIAVAVLERARLLDLMDGVVGGDQVERGKPYPDTAIQALALAAATPENAAVIGDTAHDIAMSVAAGITAYAVSYGAHDRAMLERAGPRAIVDRFVDLAEYLG